jgi:hypothetical protein
MGVSPMPDSRAGTPVPPLNPLFFELEYATEDGQQVRTKFIGGVFVDYTITPCQ